MQNVHILKYILPTFVIVIFAMLYDSHVAIYFPLMAPIQSFKTFKQTGHLLKGLIVYLFKWYGIWILVWLIFHYLLFKNFLSSIKCSQIKTKTNASQDERKVLSQYEQISTSQENKPSIQTEIIQTPKQTIINFQRQEIQTNTNLNQKQQLKKSSFQSYIYPYLATFIVTFFIVILAGILVQSQISLISHEAKNGSHHSKWMGAREYYTLDFFHNIPSQYQHNHQLMDLFNEQDKAVAAVTNWIANYKLFFGLFYLFFKSFSPVGIILCFALIFMTIKINLNKDKNKPKKRTKIISIIKHDSQMSLFNVFFVLFLGFSILSASFLQISMFIFT